MRIMKDSGIEWIGDIPNDWDIIRFRFLCKVNTGNQDTQDAEIDGQYPFYVRSPIVRTSNRATFDCEGILMAGDGAGAGRIFHHAKGVYAVHQRVYCFNNFTSECIRYVYYYISTLFEVEMNKGSSQTTVPSVRLPMIQNFNVCKPKFDEQQKIADFLDKKCSEIDSLISDIKSQIGVLEQYKKSVITEAVTKGLDKNKEMKDSGIDYLGTVNPNWHLTKLRYCCKKLNQPVEIDQKPLICSNKGKVFYRGDNSIGLVSDDDKMFQGVSKGDLLIHGMDTWHGAIAISNYYGKCTTVVHVCDSEENKTFISYFLQMYAYKKVYKAISNGVRENTSDFRSWAKMGNVYITLPPINEQNEIVEYLDNKCTEIEETISEKQSQISILEEYKKSLIFEYVTGKKEVV